MSRIAIGSLALFALIAGVRAEDAKPTKEAQQATIDKAIAYLKSTQNADGSWGQSPGKLGITGVVVTGLLQCGVSPDDEPATKGLKFIESLVNAKAGHIAGPDAKVNLHNYVTSINVMALAAAKRDDKYKAVVGSAAEFLKKLQWDDGEGKSEKDDFFGGAGYDSKSRPDLSNTAFFLEALKAAGTPASDPAMKRAIVFLSRCQNLKGEFNDQPWADKINDGSFIYSPAGGGSTKTSDDPKAPLTGYGSMTYAGIKSMIYCGITKDDPRMKAAIGWVKKNYTLDANPGMPPQLASRGLYYYYVTFAKTMTALGDDTFEDAYGVKHDWRADLTDAAIKRQKPDGSWTNETDRWMEGDPSLVTGYMMMALGQCRAK